MKQDTIYALGFFDGVHAGHAALLTACKALAKESGCKAAVVTFTSHPDALVSGAAPGLINSAADRELLLRSHFGMDAVIALPFDKAMMTMHYMTFFRMLRSRYGAAGFVCGHDFRFGNRGEGDAEKLLGACQREGIPCTVVPEQKIDGITVSSTYIRTLLERGELERATLFLGHAHIFSGTVVPGKHLGGRLGFPTANLLLPEGLLCPRKGVYACRAWVEGECYSAVTNVGNCPTVGGSYTTVESWLLGFQGDLYGKKLTLAFEKYLRPERKFGSLPELREQIQKDAEKTREIFQNI